MSKGFGRLRQESNEQKDPVGEFLCGKIDKEELKAEFDGRLKQFRSDVTKKLKRHNALNDRSGWAVFERAIMKNENGPSKTHFGIERVLIYLWEGEVRVSDGPALSTIRVITNEFIQGPGTRQLFAKDFTVDDSNNVQYLASAVDFDRQKGLGETIAPVFRVDEDYRLYLKNAQYFTPTAYCVSPEDPGKYVTPFGNCNTLEDQTHALVTGQALLEEIETIQPNHVVPSR